MLKKIQLSINKNKKNRILVLSFVIILGGRICLRNFNFPKRNYKLKSTRYLEKKEIIGIVEFNKFKVLSGCQSNRVRFSVEASYNYVDFFRPRVRERVHKL